MKRLDSIMEMLDQMVCPGFCVTKGVIVGVNPPAKALLIDEGTPIMDLLATGEEEYQELKEGELYLTLRIHNKWQPASVKAKGRYRIFVLERDADLAELNAMALAARELREPLSNVLTVADRLFPMTAASEESRDQAARINRGLYQMLRIIGNMSDAVHYVNGFPQRREMADLTALLEEIFRKATHLIGQTSIQVRFKNLPETVWAAVDEEMLERAIYNILSNAAKFTPNDGYIEASAKRRGGRLYLTVRDSGEGIDPALQPSLYTRYQRQPGIEDSRFGIGLGMVLIRSAAAAHGGTVLLEHPAECGTRITMTLSLSQDNTIRDRMIHVDYAGERDHALIELSDRLSVEAYYPEHIN